MSSKKLSRAGKIPFGLGQTKPRHYRDMLRVAWENRDELAYAWRILSHGVCDGCALGTAGLHDWTMDDVHLCMVRLELMRLNTAPALDPARLRNVDDLAALSEQELRELGRLPEPMIRRKGEKGFGVVTWEEAYTVMAEKIRAADPQRFAVYLTSRGMLNEHYYAAQKAARAMGTNHVDNSARLCHSASTTGMQRTLGYGATTCSYRDWLGTDLIVFFGSNTANNQPVTMKYLYYARQRGAKVAVVNPYFEPGLERYWVPSITDSAVFGTKFADEWFAVDTGGDLAFLNGVFKILVAENWIDQDFITRCTAEYDDAKKHVENQDWEVLEKASGTTRQKMKRFAEMLRDARSGIFVWSMGLTQHAHGVDTIQALMNVGLARGWVGRENTGMMPIRGHSGVQGGAEVGCVPNFSEDARRRLEQAWQIDIPTFHGLSAAEMVAAAYRSQIDVFWMVGGNFLGTLPDPAAVASALENVGTRIHQDIVLTPMMLLPPGETVVLLPATTRYESPGGGTETTTERRIIFSPDIHGHRIGSAKPEWEVFGQVAARVRPEHAGKVRFASSHQIRNEIANAIPLYAGIEKLMKEGDNFQWGGERLFADGTFATPDGKAHFSRVAPPQRKSAKGTFLVSTRRGKQFNAMVHRAIDPLNGARRQDVLMSREDAETLSLQDGDQIRLVSGAGTFEGLVKFDRIKSGNLEVHWPEGNTLLSLEEMDLASREPDYNAEVTLEVVPVCVPPQKR